MAFPLNMGHEVLTSNINNLLHKSTLRLRIHISILCIFRSQFFKRAGGEEDARFDGPELNVFFVTHDDLRVLE